MNKQKLLENIVKKALTQQIKEGNTGSELSFQTIVKSDHISNHGSINFYYPDLFYNDLNPTDSSLDAGELTIDWSINIDARNWGVKDIVISIENIHGELNFTTDTDDDVIQIQKEFKLTPEWKITNEMEISSGSIFPTNVSIDAKNKTIEIS
jgi:hypothetical protein